MLGHRLRRCPNINPALSDDEDKTPRYNKSIHPDDKYVYCGMCIMCIVAL